MDLPEEKVWPGRWSFMVGVIVGCWVLSLLSVLSWLILPLLGFAVICACRRGAWLPLLLLLLANPLAVWFFHGMVDYAKGAPKLHGMGLPEIEDFNIDRETRCFPQTGGCLISGNEWVAQDSHNLGVRALVAACGFPRRSYDGPYPEKEEALRAVAGTPKLDLAEFAKGRMVASGRRIEMDPKMLGKFASTAMMFGLMDGAVPDDDSGTFVQAVVFKERCLILRYMEPDLLPATTLSRGQDFLVLIDMKCLRPFAYYWIQGHAGSRYPRVRYLVEDSR
jgi:hypothetical protein